METLQGAEEKRASSWPADDGDAAPSSGATIVEADASSQASVMLELGRQLRRLRVKRGLSLARLGEQAGVSRAMLCQIELGQSAPTVTLLAKIARALRVPLASIVGSLEEPTVKFVPSRKTESYRSSDGRYETRVIFPKKPSLPGLEEYRLDVGATDVNPVLPAGAFVELVVTSGFLEVRVGERGFSLASGDGLLFDTDLPTKVSNPGPEPVTFLVVLSPREDG